MSIPIKNVSKEELTAHIQTKQQESVWGRHKVKILTGVAILGVITCVALAVLCWPASFGVIGAWAIAHGLALIGLPIAAKIAIVVGAGAVALGSFAGAVLLYKNQQNKQAFGKVQNGLGGDSSEDEIRKDPVHKKPNGNPSELLENHQQETTSQINTPKNSQFSSPNKKSLMSYSNTPSSNTILSSLSCFNTPHKEPLSSYFYTSSREEVIKCAKSVAQKSRPFFENASVEEFTKLQKVMVALSDAFKEKEKGGQYVNDNAIPISAYIYLEKIKKKMEGFATLENCSPSHFMAALLFLSAKWNSDNVCDSDNKTIAKFLKIPVDQFNEIETACLKVLNYNLWIDANKYKSVQLELDNIKVSNVIQRDG